MEELPVFRASKKRKFTRHKGSAEDDNETIEHQNASIQTTSETLDPSSRDDVNVSNILKLRKQNKSRNGVYFSNLKLRDGNGDGKDEADAMALVPAESKDDSLQDVSSRFTKSTGPVVDIDRHMMAYIDSEMAKRHTPSAQLPQGTTNADPDEYMTASESESEHQFTTTRSAPAPPPPTKTPYASQIPLSEFDLGPQAHDLNRIRTEAAITLAQGGVPAPSSSLLPDRKPRRQRKPRLGRDGKPLRPRPRKRRDSSDIARDALVEQVMSEHRLESVYDSASAPNSAAGAAAPASTSISTSGGRGRAIAGAEDADERLAEQFRQEFLDAVAERQQRNQNMAKGKAAKGQETQVGGPKLGGSRSARAKMQASLQMGGEKK